MIRNGRVKLLVNLSMSRHTDRRQFVTISSLNSFPLKWSFYQPTKVHYYQQEKRQSEKNDRGNGQCESESHQAGYGGYHYDFPHPSSFFRRLFLASSSLPLLAFSLKQFLHLSPPKLDDDPLKDKVKQAMLYRKYSQFPEAVKVLTEAMGELASMEDIEPARKEKIITRLNDELANTYYEAGELDQADQLFRIIFHRLIVLHQKNESSPELIGLSLKLADIFARKGDLESAEIGYKHCLSKQLVTVDDEMKKFHIAQGALLEPAKEPASTFHGINYTDPVALLGMCLEDYAHFLLDYYSDSRMDEAEEYIKEAIKLSHKIYGSTSFPPLHIVSNFGAKCILKNKFEMAKRFLEQGIGRVLLSPDCEPIVISYYCNYAEALFHTGEPEKAVDFAQRAFALAQRDGVDPNVRKYVGNFMRDLKRDAARELVNGKQKRRRERIKSSGTLDKPSTTSSEANSDSQRTLPRWLWPF